MWSPSTWTKAREDCRHAAAQEQVVTRAVPSRVRLWIGYIAPIITIWVSPGPELTSTSTGYASILLTAAELVFRGGFA